MTDIQTGLGLVWLDVSLALMAGCAAGVQYWRLSVWKSGWVVRLGRWCIALGWTTLSVRVTERLISSGDILISLPSLISLILVLAGSLLVTIFWKRNSEGPR